MTQIQGYVSLIFIVHKVSFIWLFFLLVSMLVFKHSFGKGNKKRKGEKCRVYAVEARDR